MTTVHLEVLVEELSAERALDLLLPRIVPGVGFDIRPFRGKANLLRNLPKRLAGYAHYAAAAGLGIVVLADRDADECQELKERLEKFSRAVGLATLTTGSEDEPSLVANRIAVEELEAWFSGDVDAMVAAFPGVPASLGQKAAYRDPDAIAGGTHEAFARVLQDHGHHLTGLRKVEAAGAVAAHMNVDLNRSGSFVAFRDGVRRLVRGDH